MPLYTPFPAGESPFNAANANSRLQELENAILGGGLGGWDIIVPFTVITGGVNLVEISNIPSTYRMLNLKLQVRNDDTATGLPELDLVFEYNDDDWHVGTHYNASPVNKFQGAVFSGLSLSQNFYQITSSIGGSPAAEALTSVEMFYPDYSLAGKQKSMYGFLIQSGRDVLDLVSFHWSQLDVINKIDMQTINGNFTTNSGYELLGLK